MNGVKWVKDLNSPQLFTFSQLRWNFLCDAMEKDLGAEAKEPSTEAEAPGAGDGDAAVSEPQARSEFFESFHWDWKVQIRSIDSQSEFFTYLTYLLAICWCFSWSSSSMTATSACFWFVQCPRLSLWPELEGMTSWAKSMPQYGVFWLKNAAVKCFKWLELSSAFKWWLESLESLEAKGTPAVEAPSSTFSACNVMQNHDRNSLLILLLISFWGEADKDDAKVSHSGFGFTMKVS